MISCSDSSRPQHRRRQQLRVPANFLDLYEIAGAEVFKAGIKNGRIAPRYAVGSAAPG